MTEGEAAIAIATLVLGVATVYLGLEAKWARAANATAETQRQRQGAILAIRPLLIAEPTIEPLANGLPCLKVTTSVHADIPVLNLNVTVRGLGTDGPISRSTDRGSLPAGTVGDVATVDLYPFLDLQKSRTWGAGIEVVVTWYGLLGQWVVEHYEWDFNVRITESKAKTWRLYRLEIEPRGVPGAAALDLPFGGPPLYE